MSISQPQTRWWESYLVRYFMPSIAGAGFVLGLSQATPELGKALMVDTAKSVGTGYGLLLIFLYGSFYCYMASLPILVFHATRVLDSHCMQWKTILRDAYIASLLTVTSFTISIAVQGEKYSVLISLMSALFFIAIQLLRIFLSTKQTDMEHYKGNPIKTSRSYAYSVRMAIRRSGKSDEGKYDSQGYSSKDTNWPEVRRDITETYRHLREHGNAAFIFINECILGMFIYIFMSFEMLKNFGALPRLAMILAVWSVPAMFVHMLGQQLERRFSHYDSKPGVLKPEETN